jgi:hypothetical protein
MARQITIPTSSTQYPASAHPANVFADIDNDLL